MQLEELIFNKRIRFFNISKSKKYRVEVFYNKVLLYEHSSNNLMFVYKINNCQSTRFAPNEDYLLLVNGNKMLSFIDIKNLELTSKIKLVESRYPYEFIDDYKIIYCNKNKYKINIFSYDFKNIERKLALSYESVNFFKILKYAEKELLIVFTEYLENNDYAWIVHVNNNQIKTLSRKSVIVENDLFYNNKSNQFIASTFSEVIFYNNSFKQILNLKGKMNPTKLFGWCMGNKYICMSFNYLHPSFYDANTFRKVYSMLDYFHRDRFWNVNICDNDTYLSCSFTEGVGLYKIVD